MTNKLSTTAGRIIGIAMVFYWLVFNVTGCSTQEDGPGRAPDLQYAAQKGIQATVFIETQMRPEAITDTTSQGRKAGSGTLISADGYIVTNYHVVSHAESIHITMHNGMHVAAELIGTDSAFDMAVIRINGSQFPYVKFGDSDALRPGEPVVAIGNPYNLHFTVTSGIVSAVNRDLRATGNATRNFIQTDVPINTGNSGGPLLNARGELVGIMAILVTVSGQYEGYSFAMPSNLVQKLSNDLRQHGKRNRGSIGMVIRPVTREIADYAKMREVIGVVVDIITDGGAADLAGIQSLDIILAADGKRVESVTAFLTRLPFYSRGDTMHVIVNRDGKELALDVVMQ